VDGKEAMEIWLWEELQKVLLVLGEMHKNINVQVVQM